MSPRTSEVRQPGHAQIYAPAAERDALGRKKLALMSALGQRAVGAHHSIPGQLAISACGEHRAGDPWRARRAVAVRAHEPWRDFTYTSKDGERTGAREIYAGHGGQP
jgi:hypothetical protein